VSSGLGDDDRRQLHETFVELCRIPSPTGHERGVADWITTRLQSFRLELSEDGAGPLVGADAGNLLTRIPGRDPDRWVLLCAHMDTVPPTAPLDPVLVEGGFENAGEGILGADNKSAVAALLELARILTTDEPPEIGVELLFTVSEETGLLGATVFDVSQLRSEFGFVFDHASPIGEVIAASPTLMQITAEIHGRAAHAGIEPELGANAIVAAAAGIVGMPDGRLDPETTANVGVISGGTAINVVAERCVITSEIRGIEQARVDQVLEQAIDALQDGADGAGCDLDIVVEKKFTGYRVRPSEASLLVADKALRQIGYQPKQISSGGGSDANAFRLNGFQCTNLANGTERAHQPTERVSLTALEDGLALALAVVREAAWRQA
jgi:tripeptide aminopeptidase